MRRALRRGVSVGALLLAGGSWLAITAAGTGHRRPPSPSGLVLRLVTREVVSPFDGFVVFATERNGPAIVVLTPRTGEFPATRHIYSYPDGKLLEEARLDPTPVAQSSGIFDFDGDGVADRIDNGSGESGAPDYGVVRVYSGRDGHVLFVDRDDLEYEGNERAFPLPDLDGDGCSELALLYPRMDRSSYDLEVGDMLFGAKSWVSIVSGARATR
jgi:hypothetical protein